MEENKGPAGGSEKHKVNEPAAVNKELEYKKFFSSLCCCCYCVKSCSSASGGVLFEAIEQ